MSHRNQTVNIAARLQAAASAGEPVMVAEAMDRAGNNGWLPRRHECETFERPLRGVGTVKLARLELDSPVHT